MFTTLANLFSAVREWRRLRADARALERLDDRTLRDIGLSRSEIGSAVHEAANGLPTRLARGARRLPAPANVGFGAPAERRHAA